MYDVYGIVKVEMCSNNKGLQLYLLVTLFLMHLMWNLTNLVCEDKGTQR